MVRVLHQRVVTANRGPITSYLEPQQLALTKAGGFILVHAVRMMMEEMRNKLGWVAVKIDVSNAHNEMARASVVEVLEDIPELKHLTMHAAVCLAGEQGLEARGKLW